MPEMAQDILCAVIAQKEGYIQLRLIFFFLQWQSSWPALWRFPPTSKTQNACSLTSPPPPVILMYFLITAGVQSSEIQKWLSETMVPPTNSINPMISWSRSSMKSLLKFWRFYVTSRLITMFTEARHWTFTKSHMNLVHAFTHCVFRKRFKINRLRLGVKSFTRSRACYIAGPTNPPLAVWYPALALFRLGF
jgi:hypothetical protein